MAFDISGGGGYTKSRILFYRQGVGVSMNFGTLSVVRGNKERPCQQCGEPIAKGIEYYGLFSFSRLNPVKSFKKCFHKECLVDYVEVNKEVRRERDEEKRREPGGKGGRPRVTNSPEEAIQRAYVQHNLWKRKKKLSLAYESGDEGQIKGRWLGLAELLEQYAGIGGEYYSLGKDVTEKVAPNLGFYEKLVSCNRKPGLMAEVIKGEYDG